MRNTAIFDSVLKNTTVGLGENQKFFFALFTFFGTYSYIKALLIIEQKIETRGPYFVDGTFSNRVELTLRV